MQKWFNNNLTYYLLEGKAVVASLQLREGKKPTQETNENDSLGKGFQVLNCLMTGRSPRKSLQLRPKFHSLFSKIALIFKKCYI